MDNNKTGWVLRDSEQLVPRWLRWSSIQFASAKALTSDHQLKILYRILRLFLVMITPSLWTWYHQPLFRYWDEIVLKCIALLVYVNKKNIHLTREVLFTKFKQSNKGLSWDLTEQSLFRLCRLFVMSSIHLSTYNLQGTNRQKWMSNIDWSKSTRTFWQCASFFGVRNIYTVPVLLCLVSCCGWYR